MPLNTIVKEAKRKAEDGDEFLAFKIVEGRADVEAADLKKA